MQWLRVHVRSARAFGHVPKFTRCPYTLEKGFVPWRLKTSPRSALLFLCYNVQWPARVTRIYFGSIWNTAQVLSKVRKLELEAEQLNLLRAVLIPSVTIDVVTGHVIYVATTSKIAHAQIQSLPDLIPIDCQLKRITGMSSQSRRQPQMENTAQTADIPTASFA